MNIVSNAKRIKEFELKSNSSNLYTAHKKVIVTFETVKQDNSYDNIVVFKIIKVGSAEPPMESKIVFDTTQVAPESFIEKFVQTIETFMTSNNTLGTYEINQTLHMLATKLSKYGNYDTYFLKHKNDYSYKDIIKFFALNHKVNEKDTEKFVEYHLELFGDDYDSLSFNTSKDVQCYFFPELLSLDKSVFTAYRNSYMGLPSMTADECILLYKLKLLSFDKINTQIDAEIFNNTLLKDWDTSNVDKKAKTSSIKRCLDTVEYLFNRSNAYEELNNLTIIDAFKLITMKFNKSNYFCDYTEVNDELFKDALNKDNYFSFESFNKLYTDVLQKGSANNKNRNIFIEFYASYADSLDYYCPALQIIEKYVKEKDVITVDDMEFFITPDFYQDNSSYPIFLISFLFKNATGVNAVNIVQDVMESGINIRAKQWMKFIDNFESYKDMPVSWWRELL